VQKLVTDTIVDIITENNMVSRDKKSGKYKKGFFLKKSYLPSRTTLKNQRPLVNVEYVEKEIQQGRRVLTVPADAIITPMAQLLLDEKGIQVQKK